MSKVQPIVFANNITTSTVHLVNVPMGGAKPAVRLLEIHNDFGDGSGERVGLAWDGHKWRQCDYWRTGKYCEGKTRRWRLADYSPGYYGRSDMDWSLRGWLAFELGIHGPGEPTDAEVNEIAAELERRAGLVPGAWESYERSDGFHTGRWWRPVAQG